MIEGSVALMFKKIRVAILLLVLLFVALSAYTDRLYSTDWDIPLRVAVFPINGDGSAVTQQYISTLDAANFLALENFFEEEASEYGVHLTRPVRFWLLPTLRELPPILPPDAGGLSVVLWSLRTRYWAWRVADAPAAISPDIKLFVLYHDPALSPRLPHSIGLQKGLFGIVNVFAAKWMEGSNDTVIAHEFLHTLGATDKYDLATTLPLFPAGYADPDRKPLYPQELAELMGGRIPLSAQKAEIPVSLQQVVIGPDSAAEIGWKSE